MGKIDDLSVVSKFTVASWFRLGATTSQNTGEADSGNETRIRGTKAREKDVYDLLEDNQHKEREREREREKWCRCESLQLHSIQQPRNYRCIHLGCSRVSGTVLGRKPPKFPRWLSKRYSGFRLRGFNELVAEPCIIQRTGTTGGHFCHRDLSSTRSSQQIRLFPLSKLPR